MELTPNPELERQRLAPVAGDRRWFEGHRLDLFVSESPDLGPLSLSLSVVAEPAHSQVSFSACVLRIGSAPVVVADNEVPLPGRGWELRTSGLWADHVCEDPFVHWSYGLEAFGLELDDPNALLGRGLGHRVPLGWELEFEATQPPVEHGPESYSQAGTGHGLLLDADGEHEIEGAAVRTHWWGFAPPIVVLVGALPNDAASVQSAGTAPGSFVSIPSREAVWRQAVWAAGASSSSEP